MALSTVKIVHTGLLLDKLLSFYPIFERKNRHDYNLETCTFVRML